MKGKWLLVSLCSNTNKAALPAILMSSFPLAWLKSPKWHFKLEEWYEHSQFKLTFFGGFLKSKVFKRTQKSRSFEQFLFKPVLQVTLWLHVPRGQRSLKASNVLHYGFFHIRRASAGVTAGRHEQRGVKLRSLNILTNKLMWPLTLTPPCILIND